MKYDKQRSSINKYGNPYLIYCLVWRIFMAVIPKRNALLPNQIMKITEIFALNKTQAEIDFVDIDITRDLPVFLDPFFLSLRNDNWSMDASRTIRSYFQRVLDLLNQQDLVRARGLFVHLGEVNETCLGLSKGSPMGRGVGQGDSDDLFNSIVGSIAAQTGLIQDLQDNILFVEGFGKDKLSDMTTNIIRKSLINYTQNQCRLHNIALTENVPSGFYWNRNTMDWEQEYIEMLVVEDRKILLVPKGVVSYCKDYTSLRLYVIKVNWTLRSICLRRDCCYKFSDFC